MSNNKCEIIKQYNILNKTTTWFSERHRSNSSSSLTTSNVWLLIMSVKKQQLMTKNNKTLFIKCIVYQFKQTRAAKR